MYLSEHWGGLEIEHLGMAKGRGGGGRESAGGRGRG